MSSLFCFLAFFLAVQNIDAERPIEVRVITNQLFHRHLNDMHIKVFRNMLDEYIGTKGINFAEEEIQERIVDEGGMFAVRYILRDFDCDELIELARDGKSRTDFVSAVKIKCPCRSEIVIDSTNMNQYENMNQYQ
ncbi:unnamed protein product [Cylicocyclus nassatus]|uniref:Uncharacterized protein n=1 Tax=Cylicocyclus nassatus TaxID=53992 RepID=A0AA36GS58_CYLNA|nr:unnamed protein product [Cylicocyclus nassatus]